jgi:putative nucleotidyltransferase with HDIG domain
MAEILLVGEEKERARGVRDLLRQDAHRVTWLRQEERWREVERETGASVVVMTVASPQKALSAPGRAARGFPPPILLIQNETDLHGAVHLEERLVDRLRSPFTAEELLARVDALARIRDRLRERGPSRSATAGDTRRRAFQRVGARLAAVLGSRVPRYAKPAAPYHEVAARLAEWADRRDGFEPGHAERVVSLSAMIAEVLQLEDREAAALLRAALLHDVGKVALPVEILRQRGPLEEGQMRLVRTHPERGAELLRCLVQDEEVAAAVRYHHERAGGAGYYGKTLDEIPRTARILAVAEAYDGMTTSKFRPPLTAERARATLAERKGVEFDSDCVDALLEALKPRPAIIPLSGEPL